MNILFKNYHECVFFRDIFQSMLRFPPPLSVPKSTISEKTPKLSFYSRKMQQTFLFQNIDELLKKRSNFNRLLKSTLSLPLHFFEQK